MADKQPLDGFLELIRSGSRTLGEALDKKFKGVNAIGILSFEMSSEDTEKKSKKKKSKGAATAPRGAFDDDDSEEETETNLGSGQSSDTPEKPPRFPITFKITKEVDTASPRLYLSYCQHTEQKRDELVFDKAIITLRKGAGPKALEYLVVTFDKAFVTRYSLRTTDNALPTETVTFTCEKCQIKYTPQTAGGTAGSAAPKGWDFIEHQEWSPS